MSADLATLVNLLEKKEREAEKLIREIDELAEMIDRLVEKLTE